MDTSTIQAAKEQLVAVFSKQPDGWREDVTDVEAQLFSFDSRYKPMHPMEFLIRRFVQIPVDPPQTPGSGSSSRQEVAPSATPHAAGSTTPGAPNAERKRPFEENHDLFWDATNKTVTRLRTPTTTHALRKPLKQPHIGVQFEITYDDDGPSTHYVIFLIGGHAKEDYTEHTKRQLRKKDRSTQKAFKSDGRILRSYEPPVNPVLGGRKIVINNQEYDRTNVPGKVTYTTTINGKQYTDSELKKYVLENVNTEFLPKPKENTPDTQNPIYYMYVLLADDEKHHWLYMHQYRDEFEWYSKHGVILGGQANKNVTCAGIICFTHECIYLDNLSGTLGPDRQQLEHASDVVERYFEKPVFIADSVAYFGLAKPLLTKHPDARYYS